MEKTDKSRHNHIMRICMAILLVIVSFEIFGSVTSVVSADESEQTEKHLVIRVVEDEELVDIDDYDIPLAAFSEGTAEQSSGKRHIILMSVMLACVIVFVIYQGVNEKKLIDLRKRAARAQYQMMTEDRKL